MIMVVALLAHAQTSKRMTEVVSEGAITQRENCSAAAHPTHSSAISRVYKLAENVTITDITVQKEEHWNLHYLYGEIGVKLYPNTPFPVNVPAGSNFIIEIYPAVFDSLNLALPLGGDIRIIFSDESSLRISAPRCDA